MRAISLETIAAAGRDDNQIHRDDRHILARATRAFPQKLALLGNQQLG
jgi:hypothetical protein